MWVCWQFFEVRITFPLYISIKDYTYILKCVDEEYSSFYPARDRMIIAHQFIDGNE